MKAVDQEASLVRPTLILDLDETLVHATPTPLDFEPDFRVGTFGVYRRPYLSDFLNACFALFEVAVWTSAGREYASAVIGHVFGDRRLKFFWSAERCTLRTNLETYERYTVKDLKKIKRLGIGLDRVLMVDDSPEKLERNYGNHVWIKPFEGDPKDSELPELSRYLESISDVPDFRRIEKRHWRRPG
jgi:TFIIF-interacting CTD phosphatase-like protein